MEAIRSTAQYADDDAPIEQKDSWDVVDAFFDQYGLVRQQLDSFNTFSNVTIQQIVEETSVLEFFPDKSPRNRDGWVCNHFDPFIFFFLLCYTFLTPISFSFIS